VHGGRERGEGGRQRAAERGEAARRGGRGGDEVEGDGLRAGGVAEHGEDAREGAPQVGGVQRHRDVDRRRARAGRAVAERRSLAELRKLPAASGRRRARCGEEDHGEDAHCVPGMSFSYPPPLGESSGREFDGYGCGRVGKTRLEGGDAEFKRRGTGDRLDGGRRVTV